MRLDGVDQLLPHESLPRRDMLALHQLDLAVDKDNVGERRRRGRKGPQYIRLEDLDPVGLDSHLVYFSLAKRRSDCRFILNVH